MISPPAAVSTVKKRSAGIVIDPRVSGRSEINRRVFIVTSIVRSLRRSCSAGAKAGTSTPAATTATATATATTATYPLKRTHIHWRFDCVGNVGLLLERGALTVGHQRPPIHGRHGVYGLHCDVRADRFTEIGKGEPHGAIGGAGLKRAGKTEYDSKS